MGISRFETNKVKYLVSVKVLATGLFWIRAFVQKALIKGYSSTQIAVIRNANPMPVQVKRFR